MSWIARDVLNIPRIQLVGAYRQCCNEQALHVFLDRKADLFKMEESKELKHTVGTATKCGRRVLRGVRMTQHYRSRPIFFFSLFTNLFVSKFNKSKHFPSRFGHYYR